MKTLLIIIVAISGFYAAQQAYRLYQENQRLNATLKSRTNELNHVESELEVKQTADADTLRRQIDALKASIEQQEKLIAGINSRLDALDVGRDNSSDSQIRTEIEYQASRVSALEQSLREYKSGIAREDGDLKSLKSGAALRRQTTLSVLQTQINQQQDLLRDLRDKIRNHFPSRLSPSEIADAQSQYGDAQNVFTNLKLQYEAAKAADYSNQEQQGQLNSDLRAARVDQKQLEQNLAAETQAPARFARRDEARR